MSAPKFIYLQWAGKQFESTWCVDAVGEDDIPDIKYVRADEHDRLTRELAAKDEEIAGLRAKHYEECAVIADGCGITGGTAAIRIRAAAKQ